MTTTLFYLAQAEQQQRLADDAALETVCDRRQRASNAWFALTRRNERNDVAKQHSAATKQAGEGGR